MDKANIESIYRKCLNNTATSQEWRQFIDWIKVPANEPEAKKLLISGFYSNIRETPAADHAPEKVIEAIIWAGKHQEPLLTGEEPERDRDLLAAPPARRVHFLKTNWFRYAAAILLILGTATFLYFQTGNQKESVLSATEKEDVLPGGNKAVLTLSDGQTIILDSAANGSLARQGNTSIIKLDGGKLAYKAGSAGGEMLYNTIRTPKGGQYQVILHDGTKVWLNAMSSIRFPTAFAGNRQVSVTGEAYFEISPDKSKPFQVSAGDMTIDVLGTSFNVNAYEDEDGMRTTLVEGKVNIRANGDIQSLMPGQQSVCRPSGHTISAETANIEQVLAWKNGFFYFKNADLKAVMRQLARWYDVAIVYEGELPARVFKGGIGRDLRLSDVLEILNEMGINIKLKDNKLYIMP